MKKIYVAGPMSGIPAFNFPAFMDAAKELRAGGWYVFNPAEKDEEKHPDIADNATGSIEEAEKKGFSLREALAWDLARICECDAIYMLKGWEKSSGARTEWTLATCLRLEIIYQ